MEDRIIIKIDDINAFSPCCNRLLVKVDIVTGKSKSGLYVADGNWDKEGICTRTGVVVKVPNVLHYRTNGAKYGIEWDTDMEARVGDYAFFGIMEGSDCPMVLCGDDVYFLVNYAEIRLIKREEELIPINGFILVEKVEEVDRSSILIVDHTRKQKKNKGIVRVVGNPNRCYYTAGLDMNDAIGIEVGDKVVFAHNVWTKLEDERFSTLEGNLGYCQRRWLSYKIIEDDRLNNHRIMAETAKIEIYLNEND